MQEEIFHCQICARVFNKSASLIQHVAKDHAMDGALLKCWICSKNCENGTDLLIHLREHADSVQK